MAEALDRLPLLESFPAPPSFIPQSPVPPSAFNPPPSGPPSSPLPPVPGPSRISEQDTLLFLSRRSSKYSVASSSRPQSTFSIDSNDRSINRRDSVSSSVSATSLTINTIKHASPRSARRARSPKPTILQEDIVEEPHGVPETHHSGLDLQEFGMQPPHNDADDSISSITMNDLPADDDDESGPPLDLSSFHRQHRTNRTRSASHRNLLTSLSPRSPSPAPELVKARPSDELSRAVSPDLTTLLSHTPRPRRSSSATQSRSRSRPRGLSSKSRRASEGLSSRGSRSSGGLSSSAYDYSHERKSWGDEEDYGVQIHGKFSTALPAAEVEAEDVIAKLERALDGEGSDTDSDSSLDLHTPLPHLMLRHGVLSPNSKLLSSSNSSLHSTSSFPNTPMDGRPSSVVSTASTADSMVTKSGLIKDARNTPHRKVRHRDGKTLRGGLGLTTGLGWSDSEDEDAPSPLTRRLSNLTSRTKSLSSVRSSSSNNRSSSYSKVSRTSSKHPLSRSYSYGTLDIPEGSDDDDDFAVTNTFSGYAARPRKPAVPPTAWTKTRVPTSGSGGSIGSRSGARSSARSSGSGSTFSLEVTIPDDDRQPSTPRTNGRRNVDSDDMQLTPSSTASSMSMPKTPTEPASPLLGFKPRTLNREKSLPSLPNPRTGSIRYGGGRPEKAQPLPTAVPVTPEAAVKSQMVSSHSSPAIGLPRPLQLASRSPGSPFPPKSHSSRSLSGPPSTPHSQTRMSQMGRSRISDPIPPTPPLPKPRPRTGTGMVYRSSSSNIQSLNLPSAAASRMPVRSPTQKPIVL